MFNTTQPLNLGPVTASQAFVVVHFTPTVVNGKIADSVLFRAQRCITGSDGTVTPVGPYVDKPFTAAQLAAARAANPALDTALTNLKTALETLAPTLGL